MSDTAVGSGDVSHNYFTAVTPLRLSSPIEQLPNELMVKIFLSCLPDYMEYWQSTRMLHVYRAQDAPLLLCGVCHSWRQLAITTRSLWSTIIYKGSNSDSQLHLLHLWLSRSGSWPIFVHIRFPFSLGFMRDTINRITQPCLLSTTISRVTELLIPSIGRWRELRMQGHARNLQLLINAFPNESLIALAALEVGNWSNNITPLWSAIPRSAPLRSLKFNDCSTIPAALQTDPRLVTHLELVGRWSLSLDSDLQSLRMFPNLQHAKVQLSDLKNSTYAQRDMIHLPAIVSLRSVMTGRALETFITSISVPALQCIEFRNVFQLHEATFPVASFMNFMSNSSPSLRQLIIHNFDILGPDFLRALELMGSVVELRIKMNTYISAGSNGAMSPRSLLRALCVQEAGPIVLPALQHITLVFRGAKLTDLHVKMIKSRWELRHLASRNVARLREVEIGIQSTSTGTSGLEQDGGEPLRQLRLMEAEGLSLTISRTSKSLDGICQTRLLRAEGLLIALIRTSNASILYRAPDPNGLRQ
jgi:hypothetical protein